MKRCSLRVRLLRFLLIPVALAYVIIGVASYYSAYHEAEEVYDAQLTHFAKVLRALARYDSRSIDAESKRIDNNELLNLHEYEKNFAYRVWLDGKVILYSSNAEFFGPIAIPDGFVERIIDDEHWRFFIFRDGDITVEVAEKYEVRIDLIHHILEGIFLPQLLIIPSLALILWFAVIGGLRPLNVLSGLIRDRSPQNLEAIEVPIVPYEVSPVIDSINDLMKRVDDVLEHEKQFSNYAAHELRTPLAALKTQLQVALRTEDKQQAEEMFQDLLPAIDRMQHLVDQLMMLVRIKASENSSESIDLGQLCVDTLKDIVPVAISSNRKLESDTAASAMVNGNSEMLSVLIRNLVGNALKYTNDNGRVQVSVSKQADKVVLSVMDDGIGIADKDHDNIFESFYRVAGTGVEGCGLGLAIVKWVADMHHAGVTLSKGLDGMGVGFSVTFKALDK